jgi:hypothetical protein
MFQHFDLLVVEQDIPVIKGVGKKLLGYDVLTCVQLVNVVAKETVGALYHQFGATEIELTAAGGCNHVRIDGHGGNDHNWKI